MDLTSPLWTAAVVRAGRPGVVPSVSVTLPPVSWEVSQEAGREGRIGSNFAGHYWLLGSTHYVYTVHDGQDIDPQVAGRTAIAVTLGAGNHTATAHATAAETAISNAGLTVSRDGATLTGPWGSASAGSVDYDSRGQFGLGGMQYEAPSGSFGIDTFRVMCIDPANLPSTGTIRIKGYRVRWGSTHTGQIRAAMYQGGTAGAPDSNVALLGDMGPTSGSAINANVYVPLATPIEADLADGPLWIGWMGDGASSAISSVSTSGQAASATSDFYNGGGGTAIWVAGGSPPSGSTGTFPATFTSGGSTFAFVTSIAIVYEVGPFESNMRPVGRVGTRFEGTFSDGPSDATLLVGNSYNLPNVLGMEVHRWSVNYATHVEGSDYRGQWITGGLAADDLYGGVSQDLGQTSGTDTGWSDVDVSASVPITPSERAFLAIRCDFANAGGTSALAYDTTTPEQFSPPEAPAAYYGGNTTESEYFPPGGTTNIDWDPTVPLVGTVEPNGTNQNNDNNVGVRAWYRVAGFGVA